MRQDDLGGCVVWAADDRCLVCALFRDRVQFCSGLVDLVVCIGHHGGGGHRFALAGERFIGLFPSTSRRCAIGVSNSGLVVRVKTVAAKPLMVAAGS